MGKIAYHLMPRSSMHDLLAEWRPKSDDARRKEPGTEKEYEHSLVDYLRDNLEGMQIFPQSGKGFSRGDIVIYRRSALGGRYEDVIELKLGLNSTSSHQRLIGQIESYELGRHGIVFVVICGDEVDPKFMNDLKLKYRGRSELIAIFHKRCRKGVTQVV